MLQALIDIGSNTIRMAIYRIEKNAPLEMLYKRKHAVGLAAYLKNGRVDTKGVDKTVEIVNEFKEFLNGFGIVNITAFTTAAIRGAANCTEVVDEIKERTGVAVRIITGDEEAVYDFLGATHGLSATSGVIVDVGGASTELVAFADGAIKKKISLPLGSLVLYQKYVEGILPSRAEFEDMCRDFAAVFADSGFGDEKYAELCGIGGTFKGALALYNAVFGVLTDNVLMKTDLLKQMMSRFLRDNRLDEEDTVTLLRTVPDRLRTIIPGLAAATVVIDAFDSSRIIFSDSGVREGYIYDNISL